MTVSNQYTCKIILFEDMNETVLLFTVSNTSVLGLDSWSTLIHPMPCSQSELSKKIRSCYSSFSGLESSPKFAFLLTDSYLYSPQQSHK